MSEHADPGGSGEDPSTWSVERLDVRAASLDSSELEQVRVVAQSHAYRSELPSSDRLRWAKLSLQANRRLPGDTSWERARRACQEFALRTWIIEHLGPDADPDWSPEALAADTLAALTLDPDHARAVSTGRRDLPSEQIADLRRHKNLTAHLHKLVGMLQPGPTRGRIGAWIAVREFLP